jgi:hypothetical protein
LIRHIDAAYDSFHFIIDIANIDYATLCRAIASFDIADD